MLQWLSAILATLAVGATATWLARGPLRRRDETGTGIAALSALSWREFIGIVLEALARRGYRRPADRGTPTGDADLTLVRDNGEQWLLSAKHGSAFVLGRPAVNELAAAMGVAGAAGGLLVTQGLIDDDARRAARGRPIELLDGPTLWPWVRPLLPASVVGPITASAARNASERTLAGWLVALLVGVALYFALGFVVPAPADEAPAAAPVAAAPPAGTGAGDARPVPPPAGTGPAQAAPRPANAAGSATAPPTGQALVPADPDPATLEAQRNELADAVAGLPLVSRAAWSSSSTLEIVLGDTSEDPVAAICALVERYPALAASRLQLTPPPGSDRPVRFRQCRAY